MNKPFYLTSAIPYVNAKPHIGHALEFIQTNVIARYHHLKGREVVSLCGSDENALKNVQAADKAGQPIKTFIDEHSAEFIELTKKLNASYDVWQRGSDQTTHFPSSQKLWQLADNNGDIYQQTYQGLYCVGCEAFYEPEELNEDGECPEHPGRKLEVVKEQNYFFRLSRYQDQLLQLIESNTLRIVPEVRKNEIVSFLKSGLKDISISRSNQRAKNWGVPVPGDDTQRMYVWFDALNIYQSGIGFGWDDQKYQTLWPADLHVIGKGIIRFHAVYWPAFLLSAGLPLPKSILVHEYITVDGQKMSKTVGNVYDPIPLLEKLGADPVRYYLLSKLSPFSDGDFSESKCLAAYNSDLANGLGNTAARVAALADKAGVSVPLPDSFSVSPEVDAHMADYRFDQALFAIWQRLSDIDKAIETAKPWERSPDEQQALLTPWIITLRQIAYDLQPFLPEAAAKLIAQYHQETIRKSPPLFPRI